MKGEILSIKTINELKELNKQVIKLENENEELKEEFAKLWDECNKLKELCDKYEEEHKTTFEQWKKDTQILKEIEQWLEVNDRYSQGYFKQVLNYIDILKEK